ncbi:MAG: hypothetical protein ACTHZ6_16200 [Brevibacterium aurantiacum]|uniref:hypothetical protein n=1 Tax=Brevibacterium aurantiacum TaxID=273384 RepID=UPI003F8F5F4F
MSERIITLISHPGARAWAGYEEKITVSHDLTPLAEVATPEGLAFRFSRDERGTIYRGQPIGEVLTDVVRDGDTICFDGQMPDNGGCHVEVPKLTADDSGTVWAYFFHSNTTNPLLVIRDWDRIEIISADRVIGEIGGRIGRFASKRGFTIIDDPEVGERDYAAAIYDDRLVDVDTAVKAGIDRAEDEARYIIAGVRKAMRYAEDCLDDIGGSSEYLEVSIRGLDGAMARVARGRDFLAKREEA